MPILQRDIYEISTQTTPIHGVMLRGRIRKLGLEIGQTILAENAEDKENIVRFAVLYQEKVDQIISYLQSVITDVLVEKIVDGMKNPVLSKMKVNNENRYVLYSTD